MHELKVVYSQIDKGSNLYWSHKNATELIYTRNKNTRSHITDEVKEEESKWEKETDAQFGYGEITKGALMNLISKMQRSTETLLIS